MRIFVTSWKLAMICGLGGLGMTALPASAQQAAPGASGGGVLSLPTGVKRVISIDAFNSLMIEVNDGGKTQRVMMPVRHVYSGGIARLFGGSSIPTDVFVSPGAGGNGASSARGNGSGGRGNSPFGITGVSGGGATGQGFGNTGSGFGSGGIGGLFGGAAGGLGGVSTFANRQLLPPVPDATLEDTSDADAPGNWDD